MRSPVGPGPARIVRALAAAAMLTVLVAGIPVALLAMGADPRFLIPDHWPALTEIRHWPDQAWQAIRFAFQDGSLVRAGMLIILWSTWLLLAWLIVAEIVIQLRDGAAAAARRFSTANPRRWIAVLVAAALVLVSSGTATAFPSLGPRAVATVHYGSSNDDHSRIASTLDIHAGDPDSTERRTAAQPEHLGGEPDPAWVDPSVHPELPRHIVVHGDTMWDLARNHLGDGRRFTEIADLNRDRIPDPSWLLPGWVLLLPADAVNLAVVPSTAKPDARQVVVQHGESLSDIAMREYGDPNAWPKLFDANRNRPQPDGRALRDPDLLLPGWVLFVPMDAPGAAPPSDDQPEPPAPPPEPPPPAEPTTPRPTTATPSPSSASPTTSPTTTTPGEAAGHDQADAEPGSSTAIELPSGAIVGLTFAMLIAGAAVILLLRRRSRRQVTGTLHARVPGPRVPPVVGQLERAVQARAPRSGESDDAVPVRRWNWPPPTPVLTAHADGDGAPTLDLTTVAGLGLDGDGAHDAARAAIAAILATDSLHPAELLVVGDTAASMLGATAGRDFPGVKWIDSVADGLGVVETELARRTRLLAERELREELHGDPDLATDLATVQAATFNTYRDTDPAEALPTYLVLVAAPKASVPRLHAVLELGRSLGIVGLILGDWPTRLDVADNGAVMAGEGDNVGHLAGTRLETLTTSDSTDILDVLAAARGGPDPTADRSSTNDEPTEPGQAKRDDSGGETRAPTEPRPPVPIRLRLLGPVTVSTRAGEITTGLRSLGRELLAYLAAHPEGASAETLEDQLLPDAPPGSGRAQIHTAVSHTRAALRKASGRPNAQFIIAAAGRYRLDPHLIDVDIQSLDDAITAARTAPEETGRIRALATVVDLCREGTPLDGASYAWAEEIRESIRQQAIDALSHYAKLVADTEPDKAVDALSVAISLDPYTEQLYQHLIRLHVDTGRPEAALATYRLLRARLGDIDADPSPETEKLLPVAHRNRQ